MTTYAPIGNPDDLATVDHKTMLIMVELGNNNNKFYECIYYKDGRAQCRNGRVSDAGVWQKPMTWFEAELKEREKRGKGYTIVKLAENGAQAKSQSVLMPGRSNGVSFEEAIVEQLGAGNPVLQKLLRTVVRANRHSIEAALGYTPDSGQSSSGGGMTYNVQTGQWSTALGIVTPDTVAEARRVLNDIQAQLRTGGGDTYRYTNLVNSYLRLIPQNIGRHRQSAYDIIGDQASIDRQIALLDGLEASVRISSAAPAVEPSGDKPKLKFSVALDVAPATVLATWQQQYLKNSAIAARQDSLHSNRRKWEIKAIYAIDIRPMTAAFDALRAREPGAPVMALWHSTSIGNVLSILTTGFKLPTSYSNGWAYGPGVYFSDVGTKSTQYCDGVPSYSYIAHVNMGRVWETHDWGTHGIPRQVADKQFDSTWAIGKSHLESIGQNVRNHSGVAHNEMIVYDTRRIRPVYLVEWDRKGW